MNGYQPSAISCQLVIFDLDGTLADTHRLIFDSFNFVMRKYKSIEMTPQQILSYFGPPEEVCLKNMLGTDSFDSVWRDYLDYYETHLNESNVFAGIPQLLKELKEVGKLLGIFTAKGTTTAELTLKYHGLRKLFDIVVTGSLVKNHKPDPEGIQFALNALKVEPSRAVVIGDSPSDYKAAGSAGTHFIAAIYDGLARKRFDGLECVKVNSVKELSDLLLRNQVNDSLE